LLLGPLLERMIGSGMIDGPGVTTGRQVCYC